MDTARMYKYKRLGLGSGREQALVRRLVYSQVCLVLKLRMYLNLHYVCIQTFEAHILNVV